MQNAAARMQTLISDLLTFSRVTTKAQPFRPVDLAAVTRDVISDLEARVEQTGGRVELAELPAVEADPLQMRQLMQNLIGNALKFGRPGEPPFVQVSAHRRTRPRLRGHPGRPRGAGEAGSASGGTTGGAFGGTNGELTDGEAPAPAPGYCQIAVRDNGIGFDMKYSGPHLHSLPAPARAGRVRGTGIWPGPSAARSPSGTGGTIPPQRPGRARRSWSRCPPGSPCRSTALRSTPARPARTGRGSVPPRPDGTTGGPSHAARPG